MLPLPARPCADDDDDADEEGAGGGKLGRKALRAAKEGRSSGRVGAKARGSSSKAGAAAAAAAKKPPASALGRLGKALRKRLTGWLDPKFKRNGKKLLPSSAIIMRFMVRPRLGAALHGCQSTLLTDARALLTMHLLPMQPAGAAAAVGGGGGGHLRCVVRQAAGPAGPTRSTRPQRARAVPAVSLPPVQVREWWCWSSRGCMQGTCTDTRKPCLPAVV